MRKDFSALTFKASCLWEHGIKVVQSIAIPSPMVFTINSRQVGIEIYKEKGEDKVYQQAKQALLYFKENLCSAKFGKLISY